MSRSQRHGMLFIIGICFFSMSCQKDNYEEPELTPKTYSFNIPNRINFNFSQLSEDRESIIPYSNTLTLKNISNTAFSGEYAIFAFKENVLNFDKLAFISHGNFAIIETNDNSEVFTLENSDNLFTSENVVSSILSFNSPDSDHTLNGFYTGELNIYSPSEDNPTFIRSITTTGIIDFEGQFHFLTHNNDENDVVRLQGNFNSNNLVSGNILNRIGENLSTAMNNEDEPFILNGSNLTGSFLFTKDSEERILKFNLTKQN